MANKIITVEIDYDANEVTIGEENSSGATYLIVDKRYPLDSVVQSFSNYVYTYLSGIDDNV